MKTFKNCAAQGDLMIRRIDKLPEGLKSAKSENGKFILAHSETGHNHTVLERPGVTVYETDDPFKAFIEVYCGGVDLTHERSFDTHETILIPNGVFELRRQREYVAEGFRKAQD